MSPATSKIDLHVHTNQSEDGELSPREVLALAAEKGLSAIAFTDHDTTAAVDEGQNLAPGLGIDFLPGVEMTTLLGNIDVHVLGYLLDWKDSALGAACARTRESRVAQARLRVARMRQLGFDIDFDRVLEVAAGRPPTSAILMKVLRENFARRRDEKLAPYVEGDRSDSPGLNLFLDYFTPGRPAYVPAETIDSAKAVEIILGARGVPVLAHPGRLAVKTVEALVSCGVAGIEVYCSNHTPEEEAFYLAFASERKLLVTAGSDFHGPGRMTAPLGRLRGGDVSMVGALRERRRKLFE